MTVNYKYKLKPFDHQVDALEYGWDRPEFGLFMEMGTGKSKVLIDNMAMLFLDGQINFALVIAPKGAYHSVWYIIGHVFWDFFSHPVAVHALGCDDQSEVDFPCLVQHSHVVDQDF